MFATPEQPAEAVSAVKALSLANRQGQRTYHITPANQATVLPNIHHRQATMDEIQSALAVGQEVITHTDSINVPGWSGAGYIIMDPATGDAAFKIGGGRDGGFLTAFAISTIGILVSVYFIQTAFFWGYCPLYGKP